MELNSTFQATELLEMSDEQPIPYRSYNRTWEEIESMLKDAENRMVEWKNWYEQCRKNGDLDGMKEAAQNTQSTSRSCQDIKVDTW